MSRTGRIFLTGLLAALPLLLTILITGWLLSLINQYVGPGSGFGRVLASLGFGVGASEIASYLIGLATMKRALASPLLGAATQRKTVAAVGAAIQACVDG